MKVPALLAMLALLTSATAIARGRLDGGVIVDSGSTNTTGYTVKIWSDGKAQYDTAFARVPQPLVKRLLDELAAAKHSGQATGRPCMKSASFGSTTVVRYHGWTTPDLQCGGSQVTLQIGSDVRRIVAALGVHEGPRRPVRRAVMPNELRRPEATPSPQPSNKPELRPRAT